MRTQLGMRHRARPLTPLDETSTQLFVLWLALTTEGRDATFTDRAFTPPPPEGPLHSGSDSLRHRLYFRHRRHLTTAQYSEQHPTTTNHQPPTTDHRSSTSPYKQLLTALSHKHRHQPSPSPLSVIAHVLLHVYCSFRNGYPKQEDLGEDKEED